METVNEKVVMRKIFMRLVPLLIGLYIISYIDRVNVGFAALTMNKDIGLSSAAYGWGAGIFFIGYCLFEVPSNLLMVKVGARRWIARILFTWGLAATAMSLVQGLAVALHSRRHPWRAADVGRVEDTDRQPRGCRLVDDRREDLVAGRAR